MAVTFLSALFLDLEFAIPRRCRAVPDRCPQPHLAPASRRTRQTPHRRSADSPTQATTNLPQLRMIQLDGSLFFGAVSHVAERLRHLERRDKGAT